MYEEIINKIKENFESFSSNNMICLLCGGKLELTDLYFKDEAYSEYTSCSECNAMHLVIYDYDNIKPSDIYDGINSRKCPECGGNDSIKFKVKEFTDYYGVTAKYLCKPCDYNWRDDYYLAVICVYSPKGKFECAYNGDVSFIPDP